MFVSVPDKHWPAVKQVVLSELKSKALDALEDLDLDILEDLIYTMKQIIRQGNEHDSQ